MPAPSILFCACGADLCVTLAYMAGLRTPFRVSSIPKHDFFRPGSYTIIEDIVAVDGYGGRRYREALDKRWKACPLFRRLLLQISLFWSVSGLAVAAGCTAVVFTTEIPVAFGVGMSSCLSRRRNLLLTTHALRLERALHLGSYLDSYHHLVA